VRIAVQLAGSLAVAHAAGIVHRDVKPENIIVLQDHDEDGKPVDIAKVCDFGIAKLDQREADAPDLTGVGVILGSPVYIAPEQIRGKPCDARTDLYAAGVTMYEMLSGRLPHESDKLHELFQMKLKDPPTRLSVHLPSVDSLLEDIVMRTLEMDPELRHASASELKGELVEVLKELQVVSMKAPTVSIWPERQR
jgi:serine/threonine-protein kinase